MARAARHLLGRHDFSSFRASDCQAAHAVRELRLLEVEGASGDAVSFVVEGTAFLKHMVRNLAGTLVQVGNGRRPPVAPFSAAAPRVPFIHPPARRLAHRHRTRHAPAHPALRRLSPP